MCPIKIKEVVFRMGWQYQISSRIIGILNFANFFSMEIFRWHFFVNFCLSCDCRALYIISKWSILWHGWMWLCINWAKRCRLDGFASILQSTKAVAIKKTKYRLKLKSCKILHVYNIHFCCPIVVECCADQDSHTAGLCQKFPQKLAAGKKSQTN